MDATLVDFQSKVDAQGSVVRELKAAGQGIDAALAELMCLKKAFLEAVTKQVADVEARVASGEAGLDDKLQQLKAKQEELTPSQGKKKKKKKKKATGPAQTDASANANQQKQKPKPKRENGELSKKERNKLERKQKRASSKAQVAQGAGAQDAPPSGNAQPGAPSNPNLALLTAALLQVKAEAKQGGVVVKGTDGKDRVLRGDVSAAKYIAVVFEGQYKLLPVGNTEAFYEVELWLEMLPRVQSNLGLLDRHLAQRTFVAGHALTLADLGVLCALGSSGNLGRADGLEHVKRWKKLLLSVEEVGAFVKKEFAAKKGKGSSGGMKDVAECAPLPGVKEGDAVVTRFPPEPSGHLHIGHAKAIFLNQYYAKRYKGKLLVRFDDTNPSKEKEEYEHAILDDLKSMGIQAAQVSWTSDHFELILKHAKRLIKQGDAYMDDTPADRMKQERDEGVESANRANDAARNMELFEEMMKGTADGQKWCLRAKMDMKCVNKCLRDPVFFRCNLLPHARTKTKYKAYPTYDLACPIVDSVEGVTHAMRDMNYKDRKPLYQWVLDKLGLRQVVLHDFAKLNFVNVLLSKRKLGWFVENGHVESWADPRFPTIKGILRRGMQVEALFNFMVSQGASRKESDMEWDKFWNLNKKIIDPVVPRFMAVDATRHVEITLTDVTSLEVKTIPKHPKDAGGEKYGMKTLFVAPTVIVETEDVKGIASGEEILLLQLGCVVIDKVEQEADGTLKKLVGHRNPDGDVKLPKRKIHWLAKCEHTVKARIFEFDYLITKKKIEDGEDFKDFLNPNTVAETQVLCAPGLRMLKENDCLQLLRRGYYRVDKAYQSNSQEIHLFTIPDGKAKSISAFQTATGKMQHR